jgi:hypothetical protein
MKFRTIAVKVTTVAIAAVSILIMSACTSAASSAAESSSQMSDLVQDKNTSQDYSDVYAEFFENPSEYVIFDKDGNECTEDFLKNTEAYFSCSDYALIYDYIAKNAYTISWIVPLDASEEENVHGCNVWYSSIVDLSEISGGEKAEITYVIQCEYTLYEETQEIKHCENAVISAYFSTKDDISYLQQGTSTPTATIEPGNDSAVFRAKFSLQVNKEDSDDQCVLGPFYAQAICNSTAECIQSIIWQ